ncbi:two-component system sensor histidine kinase BaeS [Catenuloplanes nepalensis]|uniref:histidine kinase n=1 Tax=Catenuloplanes nepalensis TaxID=587533 RepID=A0ABT9N6X9_9ACTN|nr:HAMP domain-containing sensor histidine kinase [Catenuloplanes nepalensis]MDP9799447.1 two-component system sensor histidine kinase BaeS [Catenuloplanes nepalensis]
MPRAVPLHRSLVVRLLATSMLIAVCAVAATAWLTVQLTKRAVTQEQSRTLASDTDVYDAIIAYAATHDRWDGVDELVRRQAELTGTRIALTTPARGLIAASSADAPATVAASDVPTATVDPLRLDRGVARVSGGLIDSRAVGPYRLTDAERDRLRRLADVQVICLRRGNVTAEVVELPSGRPAVREVTGEPPPITPCDPAGLLDPVETERKPLADLVTLTVACLRDAGNPNLRFTITPEFIPRYEDAPPEARDDRRVRECIGDARRDQLRPYVAPPALLFVTGPSAPETAVLTLSPANTARIAGTAALILLLTLAVTVVAGLRLVRPLRALTEAARAPANRQAPVPVTTRDEIGYLAAAFNDLSARRQALERQRNAMVNDIAHELRTPLTNIRTWLETARDGAVAVDQEVLDLLVDESVLLHHVVDDLRDIAALEAGSLRVHPEPTYVRDLLEQLVEAHRGGGAVTLDPASDDPEADVDPVRLRQIVGNLVSNAIRHTSPGGTVTVKLEMRPGRMVISVSDTGPGIAPADLPRVFDRFWRADSSRSRATGGSGLGLPIARELARAHGGDLTATSVPGRGATFTVILPVTIDREPHANS